MSSLSDIDSEEDHPTFYTPPQSPPTSLNSDSDDHPSSRQTQTTNTLVNPPLPTSSLSPSIEDLYTDNPPSSPTSTERVVEFDNDSEDLGYPSHLPSVIHSPSHSPWHTPYPSPPWNTSPLHINNSQYTALFTEVQNLGKSVAQLQWTVDSLVDLHLHWEQRETVLPPPIHRVNLPSWERQETSTQTEPTPIPLPVIPLHCSPENFQWVHVFHHITDILGQETTRELTPVTSIRIYYQTETNDIHCVDICTHVNEIFTSRWPPHTQRENNQ